MARSHLVIQHAGMVVALIVVTGCAAGQSSSTSTALGTPSSTPMALQPDDPALDAGTYVTQPLSAPHDSISFTFTVPDGWRAFGNFSILPVGEGSTEGPDGMAMGITQIPGLYSDPCDASGPADVPVGTTVDDLVNAFTEQSAYVVTPPTDVTLGGYSGKRLDLQLPSDLDAATCDYDEFFVWEGSAYAQGPGNRWHLWILDVAGAPVVIFTADFAGTPAEETGGTSGNRGFDPN